MLAFGLFLWLIYAALAIRYPTSTNKHTVGLITAISYISLYGGLIFLAVGMFLRASAWIQDWKDGTDAPYDAPTDVIVSERIDFPAEDDPDF